uniref:Uncharacterized protein n=1 Tax=Rhizophora mucronata TaxID=61149 RepID=A0A2P2NMU3_RHIMU
MMVWAKAYPTGRIDSLKPILEGFAPKDSLVESVFQTGDIRFKSTNGMVGFMRWEMVTPVALCVVQLRTLGFQMGPIPQFPK